MKHAVVAIALAVLAMTPLLAQAPATATVAPYAPPTSSLAKNIPIPGRGGSFMAADGSFYISDVNAGVVSVLKNDQIVDVIKVEGRPHGLAVDPTTGDVYTTTTVATRPGVTKATRRATTGVN